MNPVKLTLIRGLPGSGKSTLAKQQPAVHFEADMFFMKDAIYCYEPTLVQQAHQWCEAQTAATLQQGQSVVVSNTFIQWWQIKPYVDLAKHYNIPLKLIEATGDYANVHAVPEERIAQMQAVYESNRLIIAKIKRILSASRLCLT